MLARAGWCSRTHSKAQLPFSHPHGHVTGLSGACRGPAPLAAALLEWVDRLAPVVLLLPAAALQGRAQAESLMLPAVFVPASALTTCAVTQSLLSCTRVYYAFRQLLLKHLWIHS